MRKLNHNQTGFTIIELMITVSIFAILVGVALPSMNNFIEKRSVGAASDRIGIALRLARSESLSRVRDITFQWNATNAGVLRINGALVADADKNKDISVDFDGDGNGDYTLQPGYAIVFDGSGVPDPLIRSFQIFDPKQKLSVNNTGTITFSAFGRPDPSIGDVLFTLCNKEPTSSKADYTSHQYSVTQKSTGQLTSSYKIQAC